MCLSESASRITVCWAKLKMESKKIERGKRPTTQGSIKSACMKYDSSQNVNNVCILAYCGCMQTSCVLKLPALVGVHWK